MSGPSLAVNPITVSKKAKIFLRRPARPQRIYPSHWPIYHEQQGTEQIWRLPFLDAEPDRTPHSLTASLDRSAEAILRRQR